MCHCTIADIQNLEKLNIFNYKDARISVYQYSFYLEQIGFIWMYPSLSEICLYLWKAGVMHKDLDTSAPVAGNRPLVSMPHAIQHTH
jgi:hypothetical protein